jgi:Holliday junction resolvase RusA-like endonuclease
MTDKFLISMPIPPSVNNLFANGKKGRGRFKTSQYKAWITEAGLQVKSQHPLPVHGKYKLFLTLPKIRGDCSNRVKAAEDLLVSLGLIDDDRHCVLVTAAIDEELKGHATISVEGVA